MHDVTFFLIAVTCKKKQDVQLTVRVKCCDSCSSALFSVHYYITEHTFCLVHLLVNQAILFVQTNIITKQQKSLYNTFNIKTKQRHSHCAQTASSLDKSFMLTGAIQQRVIDTIHAPNIINYYLM